MPVRGNDIASQQQRIKKQHRNAYPAGEGSTFLTLLLRFGRDDIAEKGKLFRCAVFLSDNDLPTQPEIDHQIGFIFHVGFCCIVFQQQFGGRGLDLHAVIVKDIGDAVLTGGMELVVFLFCMQRYAEQNPQIDRCHKQHRAAPFLIQNRQCKQLCQNRQHRIFAEFQRLADRRDEHRPGIPLLRITGLQ